jgi:hypothetical protein
MERTENDDLDGERLEEDWQHALDAATDAVNSGARSHTLAPPDAAAATEGIRSHREWLSGFRPTLHKLFPRRRRAD